MDELVTEGDISRMAANELTPPYGPERKGKERMETNAGGRIIGLVRGNVVGINRVFDAHDETQ